MNVSTMVISGDEARRKVKTYSAIPEHKRTPDDEQLLRLYRMIGAGKRVLDLAHAFKETGLHPNGYPKLAIAKADTETVYFHPRCSVDRWHSSFGTGGFSHRPIWDRRATRLNISLPTDTFDDKLLTRRELRSPVPHIPPEIRPRYELRNYHILFEATWTEYPVDPFLLHHVTGMLFVVEGEWELTELEASLLGAMRTT